MATAKERLDVLLVKRGLVESREKAKKTIMAGLVYVGEKKIDKPGAQVNADEKIVIKGQLIPYVSRGGLKLEKALKVFDVPVEGRVFLDVGASTGGFTDCLLKSGARKVYAVDVGYGQLAWKLRTDKRVVCMERTNIRYVTPADIDEPVQGATIDVSFISLKLVLPVVKNLIEEDAHIIALVKPQFEAGREKVKKNGVVRDAGVHRAVLIEVLSFARGIHLGVRNVSYSPIKGPKGNIEFLVHLYKGRDSLTEPDMRALVDSVVGQAHAELGG